MKLTRRAFPRAAVALYKALAMADEQTPRPPIQDVPRTAEDTQRLRDLRRGVSFRIREVNPAGAIYLTKDDQLTMRVLSSQGGRFLCFMRVLLLDNTVQVMMGTITAIGNYPAPSVSTILQATECWLLSMSIYCDDLGTSPQQRGQTYAEVVLQQNGLGSASRAMVLIGDYIETESILSWPGAHPRSPIDGPGFLREIAQANPAVGVDPPDLSVPVGTRWRFVAFCAQLVCSAVVASRLPVLSFRDPSPSVIIPCPAVQAATAGQTVNFAWSGIGAPLVGVGNVNTPAPVNLLLKPNFAVHIATSGLDAGDQWQNTFLQVEEWLQP